MATRSLYTGDTFERTGLDYLFHGLTAAQREAVERLEGPLLILAGPGSGKTRVVTHRIANLLTHGVPSYQILALTFTNKAADEMRSRLELLAPGKHVRLNTFHRFCARLLREFAQQVGLRENFTIYDTSDSRQALRRVISQLDIDSTHYTPEQIVGVISKAKNNLVTAEQFAPRSGSPLQSIVARVYPAYQKLLLNSSAVDFDDLLLHVAVLLRDNPEIRHQLDARYQYIMVDEYQDTNRAQYEIIRALSVEYPNLAVTGDPDQSIYGWRGADINNILDFERDFPNVHTVRLEQNYRSTKRILNVAASLIAYNRRRKPKDLFTENDEGAPVRFVRYATQRTEAESIAARIADEVRAGRRRPRDYAVFYRTNALSREFEHAFRAHGMPFQIVNGLEFYQRKEIKDVLAYLTLINNPRDDVALLRVINTPIRGIGRTTIERLTRHASQRGLTLLEAARESGLVTDLPKKTAIVVARFVAMIDRLSAVAMGSVEEILGHVLTETAYRERLKETKTEEDQERLANIEELLTAAKQFDERNAGAAHLEEFLEETSLTGDTDAWDDRADRVTLMTLHGSKGLEFPVVHVIALEQGLIPHERSQNQPDELEEERRLLFVGITRAEEELHLSMAQAREFRGQRKFTVPSSFLFELPREEFDSIEQHWIDPTASAASAEGSRGGDEIAEEYRHESGVDDVSFDPATFGAAPENSHADDVAATVVASMDPESTARRPIGPAWHGAPLKTAADMLTSEPRRPNDVSPDDFVQGMLIKHPTYGLGRIVALSGSGSKRMATVQFVSGAGQKKFVLEQSDLRPAQGT
ncbi:MAG TPA: UvrD-helicase domain-containing protein [Pirellulales bacterium]|jgi:DNA helicase-2/ATP-dependent DNA helicase PcrA